MLQGHRRHRQHTDAGRIDEERILVRAVMRAAVLDHAQAARRDLIADAVIEQNHRVGHVLLEALLGQQAVTPLGRDHGGDAPVLQPPEQSPQLRPENAGVLEARKERLDRVEDDALGAHRPNRVIETDEQAFEIVLAGFLDLARVPRARNRRQASASRSGSPDRNRARPRRWRSPRRSPRTSSTRPARRTARRHSPGT